MARGKTQTGRRGPPSGDRPPAAELDPARSAALHLLHQLETQGDFLVLERLLAQLDSQLPDSRDRRFARQLAMGCVRWQKRLDWIADQFTRRPVESLPLRTRLLLRLGLYQLFWLDRVPQRAAVHSTVELTKRLVHRGAASLVNAVLRRALREAGQIRYPCPRQEPVAQLAVFHSHPEWLVERWLEHWGLERTTALLEANNTQPSLYIRLNSLRAEPESLDAEGLDLKPAGPVPGYFAVADPEKLFQSSSFAAGGFQIQDINAALPVALLAPQPGERLLDLCSAPGGKAVQMAMETGDSSLVLAADLAPHRLLRVRENTRRLRLRSLHLLVQDGCCPAVHPGSFTRILADVPCSATGILGRHPDIRWRRQPDQFPGLTARQQELLTQAFSLLPAGGVLVYSTCSLEQEENAGVVERFLQHTPDAALEPAKRFFPNCPWADRYLQTLPGREPGDGSFAARIRKLER